MTAVIIKDTGPEGVFPPKSGFTTWSVALGGK